MILRLTIPARSANLQPMAITEFSSALNQVAAERGIPIESVLESIRMALVSAYKKDFLEAGNSLEEDIEITALVNPDTGEATILMQGKDVTPAGFGRIAAQTAKQVILQKIRETEKDVIMREYTQKVGDIVLGLIFRIEGNLMVFDLGKAHGIMPPSEKVASEDYRLNQKLKVLIKEIREGPKGTEIILSRSDPKFITKLFEQEVPEIQNGTVTIEAIAREAGSRTKIAVHSKEDKIDPVGSCVGQKGVRVQAVISELYGEKIDIVTYSALPEKFIASALSPARVVEVLLLNEETKEAQVSVPEDQLSLAIGKEGQNVRLAFKLTGWRLDVRGVKAIFGEIETNSTDKPQSRQKSTIGLWDTEIRIKRESDEEKEHEKTIQSEQSPEATTDDAIVDDNAPTEETPDASEQSKPAKDSAETTTESTEAV